jgi:hypothetical protein
MVFGPTIGTRDPPITKFGFGFNATTSLHLGRVLLFDDIYETSTLLSLRLKSLPEAVVAPSH